MDQWHEVLFVSLPLIGFLGLCFFQWCSFLALKVSLIRSLFIGYLGGAAIVIFAGVYFLSWGELVSNIFLYTGVWYGYFHFINLGEASLRLRVLAELDRTEGGRLAIQNLYQLYDSNQIVQSRLQRMIRDGQIIKKGERFYLGKGRLIFVIGIFEWIRILVMGRVSQ